MELEKGWPKIWDDVARAGVLPGVDERRYREGYGLNRFAVQRFLIVQRGPVLFAEQVAEVHRLQFAGLAPWAGQWARQAIVGEHRGSPDHRTALELRLLETQTRRLLAAVDPANLDHLARVAAFHHARFEAIHPFPDGNGRVGRTLLAHLLQYTTAAAGLGGPAGLVKPNHPNKEAYVEALVAARDTHNLAPLARHFQFELTGRAEDLGYLPSPFQIGPRSLPAEAFARELRGSVREPEVGIAAATLPARRHWLLDAKVEDLQRLVTRAIPGAKATAGLGSVRKLLARARTESMSVGEAVALLGQMRVERPFTVGVSLGLLRRDVGPEPFQRWARAIFDPLLRSLDDRSRSRLGVAFDAQFTAADAATVTPGSVARTDQALLLELSDQVPTAGAVARSGAVVIEHQLNEFPLGEHRREPGDGEVERLEVSLPDAGKHGAALLVDGPSDGVREMRDPPRRVVDRRPAHHVNVDGPTVLERAQGLVDPEGDDLLFLLDGAFGVGTFVAPRRHERAVLVDDHAVVHHGGVVQQVHEPVGRLTVRSKFLQRGEGSSV